MLSNTTVSTSARKVSAGTSSPFSNSTLPNLVNALNPAPTVAVHQLEFILADRDFDTADPKVLDALLPGSVGFVVRANWTFSCP